MVPHPNVSRWRQRRQVQSTDTRDLVADHAGQDSDADAFPAHGLEGAAAFFPRDADAVDVSVGIYRFRDESALHAALASAETDAIMDDVPRFTDAKVSRIIGDPL